MRAGADAIEAESAVEVAGFAGEMEIHFATALMSVSAQTIMGLATDADGRFTDFDFEGRNQRCDKLKLSNGTNVFTKACALEESINGKGHEEIVDDQPSRPDWLIPEAECFVTPKE